MIEPIIKTITVPCGPDKAFDVFVRQIDKWWPLATHSISEGKAFSVMIEGHVGGRIYETTNDGTEHDWGKVTEFDEGKAFAMTWHLSNPPSEGTDIRVAFDAVNAGTKVVLRHDNWDNLGEAGIAKREGYNVGWITVFEELYADYCQR